MTTSADARTSPASRRESVIAWGIRGISLATVLLAWQVYGSRPDTFAVASVTEVLGAIAEGVTNGALLDAALGTLTVTAIGYTIAAVIGVGVGVGIAVSRWMENTVEPLVAALYATPMSLMIPIIGIYTGLGLRGRVFFTVFWCIFEIIVNTASGVRDVPTATIETARAFGAKGLWLYRRVILPAALPSIVLGLRLGIGRALRGAITAELLLAAANLGEVMIRAGASFRISLLLGTIVLVMVLGFVLMRLGESVEKRVIARRQGR